MSWISFKLGELVRYVGDEDDGSYQGLYTIADPGKVKFDYIKIKDEQYIYVISLKTNIRCLMKCRNFIRATDAEKVLYRS